MLYIIFHKRKIFGIFTDRTKCKILLEGLVNHSLIQKKNLSIQSFYENTFTKEKCNDLSIEQIFEEELDKDIDCIEKFSDSETSDDEENNKELEKKKLEEIKEKQKTEYELQKLKKQKEHIENKKNVYKSDLNIFKKLKELKKNSETVVIPEMFCKKFELMEKLSNENNLNFNSFYDLYEDESVSTSYDGLFS